MDGAHEPATPGLASEKSAGPEIDPPSPRLEKIAQESADRAQRRPQGTPKSIRRASIPRTGIASPSPRTGKGSQTMEYLNSEIMRLESANKESEKELQSAVANNKAKQALILKNERNLIKMEAQVRQLNESLIIAEGNAATAKKNYDKITKEKQKADHLNRELDRKLHVLATRLKEDVDIESTVAEAVAPYVSENQKLKNKVESLQRDLTIALTQAREQEREKLKSQHGLRIAEEKALEQVRVSHDLQHRAEKQKSEFMEQKSILEREIAIKNEGIASSDKGAEDVYWINAAKKEREKNRRLEETICRLEKQLAVREKRDNRPPSSKTERSSSPDAPNSTDFSDALSSLGDTVDENTDPSSGLCSPLSDGASRSTQFGICAIPFSEKVV